MKQNKNYIIILALFSWAISACSKQLNVYPSSSEVDGNVITDTKSAATTLNGVYYRFADGGVDYNNVPVSSWYEVNENFPSQLSGMLSYTFGGGGYDEHLYDPKDAGIGAMWNYGYGIVNAANGFLKNIAPLSNISGSTKKQMIAEAKFLRAFGNAELLLYYGQYADPTSTYGIIIRNEFVEPKNLYLPRASVAESYDSILADVSNAIPDLPSVNSSIAYANAWTAKLLKARVLVNRGTSADMDAVISLTNDIITNGPFVLEGNVKDIFLTKNVASKEVMMGILPYPSQQWKWQGFIYYNSYSPNQFMKDIFAGDPRAAWQIQTVKNAYGNYVAHTKYYPGPIAPTPITFTSISEYSYAFRLTEAYLLKAEALVAKGGSLDEAKTLLKAVRAHAGVTNFADIDAADSGPQMQLLTIKEEMRNFVNEAGQDWFAVRRLPFSTLQMLLPSITDKALLVLPIPDAEIVANKAMKQNPGY
jgi:hypothetical protein